MYNVLTLTTDGNSTMKKFDIEQYENNLPVMAAYDVGYSEFESGKVSSEFESAHEAGLAYAESFAECFGYEILVK